ncbi:MAG: hypothetical protein A2937_02230 [Candidatus Yonathbacteria bacterium RIFCSPLOWO2_01_FULL_47_33b]|uniref:Uncharacterized protein n=1 Tax=Candidatus Yonathbacteria bacterium RIFCSPLOWO2_01_FULL_47_33b TaxID=1802727 RepID=A0A1G2SDD0_9BACT|nr:MAG: hypothetical protein A2937_02230 [Candidatus Yonathbacteria bacterium RIFCSPLOWO2_01_FULL_47_33b]
MKSKTLTIFIAIIVVIISVILFVRYQSIALLEHEFKSTGNSATMAQAKWNVYINTKYGYTLQYPQSVYLQPKQEEERLPTEESSSIEMGRRGTADVGIQISAWTPYTYQVTDKTALEYNRIANLDLKPFAETLRKKFVDDKNPNFPNKNIGGLEEINFSGHKAYAATVTGYMDGYGSDTFRYIYLDGGSHKLVLQYSLKGDLSKQVIDSFKFTE